MAWAAAVALSGALVPGPVTGQAPGYTQIDTRQIFAEFHAEVLANLNEVMDAWGTAWSTDRVEDLIDLYWENAVLIPPETAPVRGAEALAAYFEGAMSSQGAVEGFMLDFDASGGMAVVYGNFLMQLQGDRGGQELSGSLVTVYLRRGRTWKIRSQIFRPG